jgi:hypothetical protein
VQPAIASSTGQSPLPSPENCNPIPAGPILSDGQQPNPPGILFVPVEVLGSPRAGLRVEAGAQWCSQAEAALANGVERFTGGASYGCVEFGLSHEGLLERVEPNRNGLRLTGLGNQSKR